jgi:hypothetical protein
MGMADVESPVQVGFAEFMARLMSEVFDSVITSQIDQEQRYAEILASSALTEEAYASQQIGDSDVQLEVSGLFPPRLEDKDEPSAIYSGSPYLPDEKNQAESPALFAVLGIKLTKADLTTAGEDLFLAQGAVDAVFEQVRIKMAQIHLGLVRQIIARGLPRVVVDSGRINGKLTFHLTESTQNQTMAVETEENNISAMETTAASMAKASVRGADVKSVFTLPKARILPNVKLMVKQADDTSPQSSQVKANVYGEVEITFKTII